jgi:lipoprotein signal peptidase
LYYIVRTLLTHIRKYMGTKNKKFLDIKGISTNPMFFDSLNLFDLYIFMGTLIFAYGYNRDLYY